MDETLKRAFDVLEGLRPLVGDDVDKFINTITAKSEEIKAAVRPLQGLHADNSSQISDVVQLYNTGSIQSAIIGNFSIKIVPGGEPGTDVQSATPFDPATILQPYVRWVLDHNSLIELRNGSGRSLVPIESIYVALRGDTSSPFERLQSQVQARRMVQELEDVVIQHDLSFDQTHILRWRALARSPVMESLESRDVPQVLGAVDTQSLSLAEVFQQYRRVVILGDPGSGKTTLARWLTLKLAQALHANAPHVEVPSSQVDPLVEAATGLVDLGPSRLPVFVRVSAFAEERQRNPSLSLLEFLGHYTQGGTSPVYGDESPERKGQAIPPDQLNRFIGTFLRRGRAVIILDGLDEIAGLRDRDDIVSAIDQFIRTWISDYVVVEQPDAATPTLYQLGAPARDGGNQIIITSRIAGYHDSVLTSAVDHVTIEPMSDVAVNRFCITWMEAVYANELGGTLDEGRRLLAHREAQQLTRMIHDPRRRGVRELASNPLLITVLAMIYHQHQSELPSLRVELYQTAVSNLARSWRERGIALSEDEVITILSPLAAYIHTTSSTGLVDEYKLAHELTVHLAQLRGLQATAPALQAEVRGILGLLRLHVGLLAARGEYIYGFLHLTFQEYLAARHLLRDRARAARELIARATQPRWREPILLALGHASLNWPEREFETLLLEMINSDHPEEAIIPRGTLLVIAALEDMIAITPRVIRVAANRLLAILSDHDGPGSFTSLQNQIAAAFRQMRTVTHGPELVDGILVHALTHAAANPGLALAAAVLVHQLGWYRTEILAALSAALPYDHRTWDWPIERALREAATLPPPQSAATIKRLLAERLVDDQWRSDMRLAELRRLQVVRRPTALDMAVAVGRMPMEQLPFRDALERDPALSATITGDRVWLQLVIGLYGGLGEYRTAELLREYAVGLQTISSSRGTQTTLEWLAEQLDTVVGPRYHQAVQQPPEFQPRFIYRDSPLTPLLLRALRQPSAVALPQLIGQLQQLGQRERAPHLRAEALVALAALGAPVAPTIEALSRNQATREVADLVFERLDRMAQTIADPVVRSVRLIFNLLKTLVETRAIAAESDLLTDVVEELAEVVLGYGSMPPQLIELLQVVPDRIQSRLIAEVWSFLFSGSSEYPTYNIAVSLDTQSFTLSPSPELLSEALALLHQAVNNRWSQHQGRSMEQLPPIPRDPAEVLLQAFDNLGYLPPELHFVRGWALIRLSSYIRARHPLLVPEALTLAIASLLEDEFAVRELAIQSLVPDIAAEPDRRGAALSLALQIRVPFYRARALRQICVWMPELRDKALGEAIIAAQQVTDSLARSRLLELLAGLQQDTADQLLAEAVRAAPQIADLPNRALAFGRLALRYAPAQRDQLLRQCIATLHKIDDLRKRDQLVRRLRPLWSDRPALWRSQDPAWKLSIPWLIGREQPGDTRRPLQRWQELLPSASPDEATIWATILLAATVRDLRRARPALDDLESLWSTVLNAEQSGAAVARLTEVGAASGLRLTITAAVAVDALVQRGQEAPLLELLPLLERPDRDLLPLVERWLQHTNRRVAQHAALILAESGRWSPEIADSLVSLLINDHSRAHYRAALALYGDGSKEHSWLQRRATMLGAATLETLANLGDHYAHVHPRVTLAIMWLFERVAIDDAALVARWAAMLRAGGRSARLAEIILTKCQHISAQALTACFELLPTASPLAERTLVILIGNLSYLNRLSEEQWDAARLALGRIDPASVGTLYVNEDEATTLVQAALEAFTAGAGRDRTWQIAHARAALASKGTPLSTVLAGDPAELRVQLSILGKSRYWGRPQHDNYQAAVGLVEQHPDLFPLLLDWLIVELEDSLTEQRDAPPLFLRLSLLVLAAAAAQKLPNTFATIHDPERLERLLVNAASLHDTFPGRSAALTLLGRLRRVTPDVIRALTTAMEDVPYVQNTVLQVVSQLRQIDTALIDRVIAGLDSSHSGTVYITTQIMVALVRNERLLSEMHLELVRALVGVLGHARRAARRDIYSLALDHEQYIDRISMQYIDRLDQILYQALWQISGIASTGQRREVLAPLNEDAAVGVFELLIEPTTPQPRRIRLGLAAKDRAPTNFQDMMNARRVSGFIPPELQDTLTRLNAQAAELGISLGWLCAYLLDEGSAADRA